MSKTKRMISLILCIAIVISLFPMTVFAASELDGEERLSVGDTVLMGTKNHNRISWSVLSIEENVALLHCNYVIDFLSYGPTSSYSYADAFVPWCTDFYSSGVFSEEEQNAIISTTVHGCDNQKLFLFNKSEFLTRFPNGEGGYRPLFTGVSGMVGAVGLGTVLATDDNLSYYLASTSQGNSWLDLASYVNKSYENATSANLQNYQATYGVCPAMYVDIDQIDDSQIRHEGTVYPVDDLTAGDFITFGTFNEHPLLWRIVENDGEKIKLFCAETLFSGEIDASMHEVLAYANLAGGAWEGDSNWHTSDIRTYLNSDEETVTYKGVSSNELPSYSARAGFLTNFSESELGVMQEITHKSHTQYHRTLTDKDGGSGFARIETFPNIIEYDEEAYESLSYLNVTERVFLPDAKDLKEASEALNGSHLMEFAYNDLTENYYKPTNRNNFWLREPVISGSSYLFWGMYFLDTTENLNYCGYATFKRAIKPMCYIQLEPTQALSGDGTLQSPYALSDETGSTGDGIQVISRSPENGGILGDNQIVSITFNHEVEAVNTGLYHGNFSIVRQIEEAGSWKFETVYSLSEGDHTDTDVTISGSTVTIDISSAEFVLGETYYVLMDYGVITFKDTNAKIGFGGTEWTFAVSGAKTGTFRYNADYGETEYPYTYDDSWFLKSSTEYNHELAKMSLRTAIAAFGSGSNADGSEYIQELMTDELGFHNLDVSYPNPMRNSIGYVIGSKTIPADDNENGTQSLILVSIRGGEYLNEWGGNFVIGTGMLSDGFAGDLHEGFSRAAEEVEYGLASYIDHYQEKGCLENNCVVWIVGYSRAAATANLLAKNLDDGNIDGLGTNNVFAYCFECPQNSRAKNLTDSNYNNIMSIVNPLDFVTMVVMNDWNYGRYGQTFYLPYEEGVTSYENLKAKMTQHYRSIIQSGTKSGNVLEAVMQITGQRDMTEGAMNWLADEFGSPEEYSALYQEALVELIEMFIGNSWDNKWDKVWGTLSNAASAIAILTKLGLIAEDALALPDTLGDFVDKVLGMEDDINALMALELLIYSSVDRGSVKSSVISYTHYPELCLAWLDSLTGDQIVQIDSKYRRVFVNCPVDVSIYDSENTLVGQVIDRTVKEIENSISIYLDANDQIVISLPAAEAYRVEMDATGDGTVTYTVTEHNIGTSSAERVVSYTLVEVETGDILVGQIENLDEMEFAEYRLIHNDIPLSPTIEQCNEDITEYTVTVTVEGDGATTGGGKAVYGEYRKLTAMPNDGAKFDGWYNKQKCVSTETTYRFCVTSDITLTAKFTAAEEIPVVPGNPIAPTPTVPVPENPFVDVPDGSYYQDAVIWASEEGITAGTSNTAFSPDATCTRAQAVTFLWRAAGSPAPASVEMPFADVPSGAYYNDAVLWAVENGITAGTSDTTFSPDATCTRAQIVTFLWRAQNAPIVSAKNPFADVAEDAYYCQAVLWAVKEAVTTGTAVDTFSPDAPCTRAQIVTFLYRALR